MSEGKKVSTSGRMVLNSSAQVRILFILAGHLSLILGVIGLLLPVIPTTPFIILAAYCYARSSERFYSMLLNNRYIGQHVLDWEDHRCMRRKIKITAMLILTAMFILTISLFFETLKARILVGAIGLIAVSCVAMLPVCEDKKAQ